MKVEKLGVNLIKSFSVPESNPVKVSNALCQEVKCCGSEIASAYSKASMNIENGLKSLTSKAKEVFSKLLEQDEHFGLSRYSRDENAVRLKIGKEIQGFKGFYSDDKFASCYFNRDGKPIQALLKNNKDGSIQLLDLVNGVSYNYSSSEVRALHYYKYYPDAIHVKLRYGRNKFGGDLQEEAEQAIKMLEKLFSNEAKFSVSKEKQTVYRALQDVLSEEEVQKLQTLGEIFTDKSFCSVTTDLNVAKRFAHNNPILEIELPKGVRYIDIEKIFNIDRCHWQEAELLLNKDSKFKIKDFDSINNIIKVEYLL